MGYGSVSGKMLKLKLKLSSARTRRSIFVNVELFVKKVHLLAIWIQGEIKDIFLDSAQRHCKHPSFVSYVALFLKFNFLFFFAV